METGRTSALSQHSVGYDAEGRVINYGGVAAMTQAEVAAEARKLVTLVDAGGHRRFMKTALSGLTAMAPDYAMLCVPGGPAAPAGHDLTAEHLAAAVGLGVPVFVVVTKVPSSPLPFILRASQQSFARICLHAHRSIGI